MVGERPRTAHKENYIMKIRTESPQEDQRISQINALLNWVKLEYQKNL